MSKEGKKLLLFLLVVLAALTLAVLFLSGTIEAAEYECAGDGCELPEIDEVCWSVTSYWPFELQDNYGQSVDFYKLHYSEIDTMLLSADYNWIPTPWNGQADDTPTITGNGYVINPYSDNWGLVAGPIQTYGSQFCFHAGLCLMQHDTFGAQAYQDGVFWHDYYRQWVIGVDVLSYEPIHYLKCDGVIQ